METGRWRVIWVVMGHRDTTVQKRELNWVHQEFFHHLAHFGGSCSPDDYYNDVL